jgi:IclR family transcriptional regulator, KDG regulon repressor
LKSLRKALDIIESITDTGSAGVRELSARTGFPPATVHRILATLTARDYLRQNPHNKHYSLSTRFLMFADSAQQQIDLVPIARPHLEQLSAQTQANANLCVQDDMVAVYIDHVYSREHMLQTFTRLGARVPLYATGVGKLFLSYMASDEIEAYLKKTKLKQFTSYTIKDGKELIKELTLIRQRGCALDNQEKEPGVRCVAAPVFEHSGEVSAAISVSGATQWITMKRVESLCRQVMECAARISADLGYKTPV